MMNEEKMMEYIETKCKYELLLKVIGKSFKWYECLDSASIENTFKIEELLSVLEPEMMDRVNLASYNKYIAEKAEKEAEKAKEEQKGDE